eukprot:Skav223316  [mRNA]  locus=scaffold200:41903:46588:+ [translate_table: standard]
MSEDDGAGAHSEFGTGDGVGGPSLLRQVPLPSWTEQMIRIVLRARTRFSFFVMQSISASRNGRSDSIATTLFPIPLPFMGLFEVGPGKLGQKARRTVALRKLLHLGVMALNYEFFRQPLSIVHLLRRHPSSKHLAVYKRLWMFLKVCGSSGAVSVSGCGRKSFQLDARFQELTEALEVLGLRGGTKYHSAAQGTKVYENNDADELRPYRPLDAERIKIVGTGAWNCAPYLSDLLYMVYMEPRVNTFDIVPPANSVPDVRSSDPMQVARLCRVWDAQNLLTLIPVALGPSDDETYKHTRVFGNFKDHSKDRQIGDRRGANFCEGRINDGPSHDLPCSTSILQIEVQRHDQVLVGAVADRRDFYHQFGVSYERASTNTMFPSFPLSSMRDTKAYSHYMEQFGKKKGARDREAHGDFLGVPKPLLIPCDDDAQVFPAFAALFQGDHLGVEFACGSHSRLLEEGGVHNAFNKLCASQTILHASPITGLVIDDFFVLSVESRSAAQGEVYVGPNKADETLCKARDIYDAEEIIGSDDKEVRSSLKFKVIGAEINSASHFADDGIVSVGAPSEKRMGLAMLSCLIADLPYVTDALISSIVGSWISVLVYRKPMMAHLNQVFTLDDDGRHAGDTPLLKPLPRPAAEELLILGCLAPFAASNLMAPIVPRIYATDASTMKGGVVCAEVDQEVARIAWRSAGRKVKNQALESRAGALARLHDPWTEQLDEYAFPEASLCSTEEVLRPIGLSYDFLEVCGGAGVVTIELCKRGVVCGPVFDLTYSVQYNVADLQVISWIIFMCESRRLKSFLASPPCTTFSPAAWPCLRSYRKPLGFNRKNPRTFHGNQLAFRCLTMMKTALRTRTRGMLETPRRSKLRWTPHWIAVLEEGAKENFLASCMFGSPHQKEFCFMSVGMDISPICLKCSRDHPHIRVEGKYTKDSATYVHGLAVALAHMYYEHLRGDRLELESKSLAGNGLEDLFTNELCLGLHWQVLHAWHWRGSSHINILEVASALRALEEEAHGGGDVRFTSLIDSQVGLCCLQKGRSSSSALRPLLKRASSLSVAFGLYQAGRFAPTRLNPGDHPTRDSQLPVPLPTVLCGLSLSQLRWLASMMGLRRWSANWLRLCLLLCPSWIRFFASEDCCRRYGLSPYLSPVSTMDFDSTMGFPGEGPHHLLLFGFLCLCVGLSGAVGSHGDNLRKLQREGIDLPEGRRITAATSSVRTQLMSSFCKWLSGEDLVFDTIFMANPPDLDRINAVLVRYGRYLFAEGKPYYHFSETINSISAKRPVIRRSLQQAWDLCAMWSSFEPVDHHLAMPVQVLLGILSTCLIWGLTREAAIFALCWGMLLRIGELVQAFRGDLIFPADVGNTMDHVLLKILEPKTRFRAARHQTGKMEQPDLIAVAWLGLGKLKKHERIWPCSPSTLRSRLNRVLSKLGLPIKSSGRLRPFTLASFRPGGATYLISQTESAELVRRRGRWISLRVMEVYLQEVAASTFMTDIPEATRDAVLLAMENFIPILQMSFAYAASKIPERTWQFLFTQGPRGVDSTVQMGEMGSKSATKATCHHTNL